ALSLRSDERRALFEEAAGITHYKARRAETLRRLEETQRNLQRVHDILEELRPRVASLRRQATRTRNFEQISADLRELLRVWYGYKWEQAKVDLRSARLAAAAAESAWSAARDKLLAHQSRMDEAQGRLAQAQQRAAVLQADRDRLRQEVEAARRDQAIYRERRNSLRQQIEEAESELPLLESAANTALAEVEAATVDLKAAQDDLHAQQAHLQEFRTVFESRRAEIATRQAEVQRVEVEQRQTQNALAQAQGQLEQLRVRLGELRSDAEPVAIDGAADETIATLEATAGTARNEVIRLQSSRNDGNRARSADINRLKDLRRALRDAEQQLNRVRNDIARQEERVAQLNRQGQRAIDLEPERVIGRLASLVRIPPEHETAVVAALGDRLAAWLVTDSDGLWRAVAKARAGRDGSEARLSLVAGRQTARPRPSLDACWVTSCWSMTRPRLTAWRPAGRRAMSPSRRTAFSSTAVGWSRSAPAPAATSCPSRPVAARRQAASTGCGPIWPGAKMNSPGSKKR
ncbi:MAG: hypothetical protein DCC51_17060, partial [Anaerolineae bacterium]